MIAEVVLIDCQCVYVVTHTTLSINLMYFQIFVDDVVHVLPCEMLQYMSQL